MNVMHLRSLACLIPLFVFACDGQKDDSYAGDALASISGTIVKDPSSNAEPGVKVALHWTNFVKDGDTSSSMSVETSGAFPARFTLDVVQPPPADALNDFTRGGTVPEETRVGTAMIIAVRPDAPTKIRDKDLVGIAERFVVAYADSDVKPGTQAAALLSGTPAKGYHLMKVVPAAEGEIFDKLVEVDGGFGTAIDLKLAAADQLEIPNFH